MRLFRRLIAGFGLLGTVGYASTSEKIVNENYSRRTSLYNTIVREEHHISARLVTSVSDEYQRSPVFTNSALASEIHEKWFPGYIVVIEKERAENVASFAAFSTESGHPEPMQVSNVTEDVESCKQAGFVCLSLAVDMTNYREKPFNAIVMISYIDTVTVAAITPNQQNSEYRQVFVIPTWSPMTPYELKTTTLIVVAPVLSVKAKLVCPQGRMPRRLEAITPSGQHSFACVPIPGSAESMMEGPTKVNIIGRSAIFLRIKKLTHSLTLLPWSKRIQITDHYEVYHEGFKTNGFNRMEYIDSRAQARENEPIAAQHVSSIGAYVPSSARTLELRDQVGINYKEIVRQNQNENIDILQLPFRFPLVGGQYYEFDFYYSIAYEDFIVKSSDTSSPFRYLLSMPLFLVPHDLVVDNFNVVINLPEDAQDIEYDAQTDRPLVYSKETFRTFFTTKGEQRLKFHFDRMIKEEMGTNLDVVFTYPWWGVSRKPLAAVATLFIIFIVMLRVSHASLSFKPETKSTVSKSVRKQHNRQLSALFSRRRDLLRDLEDLMSTYWHVSRLAAQDFRSDMQQRQKLSETLLLLEDAIFERLKAPVGPNSSSQQQTLSAIALKQLYSDQLALINNIVDMVARSKGADPSSFQNSSLSMGSASLGSMEALSQVHALAESKSTGELFTSFRSKDKSEFHKEIQQLAASASELDNQIMSQERKFLY